MQKNKLKTKQKVIHDDSVFDMDNLDDVPKSVRQKVMGKTFGENQGNLLALFNIRPILSLDEMIIGLYRTVGADKKRNALCAALYQLVKKNILRRTLQGYYELVDKK